MDEFMKNLLLADENRCNVDMLVGYQDNGKPVFGVRLRPWANKTGKSNMVLGSGSNPNQALAVACEKAAAGRWEPLDFARRPWETERQTGGWNV